MIGERRVEEGKSQKVEEVRGKGKGVLIVEMMEIEEDEDEDLLDSNPFSVLGDDGPHGESSTGVCSKEVTSSKEEKAAVPLATTNPRGKTQKAKEVVTVGVSLCNDMAHGERKVVMMGESSNNVSGEEATMQLVVVPPPVQPELR